MANYLKLLLVSIVLCLDPPLLGQLVRRFEGPSGRDVCHTGPVRQSAQVPSSVGGQRISVEPGEAGGENDEEMGQEHGPWHVPLCPHRSGWTYQLPLRFFYLVITLR